jgi:hypothetical protein
LRRNPNRTRSSAMNRSFHGIDIFWLDSSTQKV